MRAMPRLIVAVLLIGVWATHAAHASLVCPPFCVGPESEYRILQLPLAFRGRVVAGLQTAAKRLTGSAGEINYLVELLEVFKGGLFLKRVGKNTVHVYSGLSFTFGTECSVALQLNQSYLFAGQPHAGTTAKETAHIDINNCTVAQEWSTVSDSSARWLREYVQPRALQPSRCEVPTPACATPPPCAACPAGTTCLTNAFLNGWCGPCQHWCVPVAYTQPRPTPPPPQ